MKSSSVTILEKLSFNPANLSSIRFELNSEELETKSFTDDKITAKSSNLEFTNSEILFFEISSFTASIFSLNFPKLDSEFASQISHKLSTFNEICSKSYE